MAVSPKVSSLTRGTLVLTAKSATQPEITLYGPDGRKLPNAPKCWGFAPKKAGNSQEMNRLRKLNRGIIEGTGQCEAANFASPLSSPTVEAVKMPEKIVSHRSVKAIQTKWRNRHYRSRLEARWAVFFDTIGLKFMYEPEGYELPDGTRYLPDFYLPEVRWFVEVKPFTHTSIKAYHFARYGGGAVLVLDGDPDFRSYTGLQTVSIDGEPEQVEGMEYSLDIWGGQNRCNFEEGRLFCGPDYESIFLGITNVEEAFSIRYRAGVEAALSARFGS